MAGTHKEARLREPANGTSQVRTIYGEDLELLTVDISNPARNIAGFAIPRIDDGISIGGETSLPSRKVFQSAQRNPRLITGLPPVDHRRKQIAHDRHGQGCAHDTINKESQLQEHRTPGHLVFCTHRCCSFARSIQENRIRLSGESLSPAGKPRHDIGNLLCRHRLTFDVGAPVRRAQFGPPCNHYRSKLLVT